MKKPSTSSSNRKETVRGVVVPKEWDNKYQVTEVLIACKGEREIRIDNPDKFPTILSLSQKEALVTGTVTKDDSGESIIVESFNVITK
ncbi:MAG: hypothetical protein JEY79_10225 [Pseudodesulfovibrio sp.]|nr:hypothetical protein [Pseudodesulfovibrio sp.]